MAHSFVLCRALYVWLCAKDLHALRFEESAVQPGSPEELLLALARHTHSPLRTSESPPHSSAPEAGAPGERKAHTGNASASASAPATSVSVVNGTCAAPAVQKSPNSKPLMSDASYATAYAVLARFAGLECAVVEGFVKGFRYEPGDSVRDASGSLLINHAWNAVRVDGQWRLLDACAGARYSQCVPCVRTMPDPHVLLADVSQDVLDMLYGYLLYEYS